jgi:hypothetical protein
MPIPRFALFQLSAYSLKPGACDKKGRDQLPPFFYLLPSILTTPPLAWLRLCVVCSRGWNGLAWCYAALTSLLTLTLLLGDATGAKF